MIVMLWRIHHNHVWKMRCVVLCCDSDSDSDDSDGECDSDSNRNSDDDGDCRQVWIRFIISRTLPYQKKGCQMTRMNNFNSSIGCI